MLHRKWRFFDKLTKNYYYVSTILNSLSLLSCTLILKRNYMGCTVCLLCLTLHYKSAYSYLFLICDLI